MNTLNRIKNSTFVQVLIFNVATIAAIFVGVFQFIARSYQENSGNEKVLNVVKYIVGVVDTLVQKLQVVLNNND